MKLRGIDDPRIFDWLLKKSSKYTTADMQNRMLSVMSLKILREIAGNIQNA